MNKKKTLSITIVLQRRSMRTGLLKRRGHRITPNISDKSAVTRLHRLEKAKLVEKLGTRPTF